MAADWRIKRDTINTSNPGGTSAFLVDTGSGYVNITIDQLKALVAAGAVTQADIDAIEAELVRLDLNKANDPHTHDNATNTVAGFLSPELHQKLVNIVDYFKGYHTSGTALSTAHPTGVAGNYAYVGTTSKTIWIWDTSLATPAWTDTGVASAGDMLASIYDPRGIAKDVFDRANHTGSLAISTITNLQTTLDGKEPAFVIYQVSRFVSGYKLMPFPFVPASLIVMAHA